MSVFSPWRMAATVLYTHAQPPTANLGTRRSASESGVAAVHARDGEGMIFADDIVRVLLAVRRQVAVGEAVSGHTLVTGDPSTLENRKREASQPTRMDLIESQTRGAADGIVAAVHPSCFGAR